MARKRGGAVTSPAPAEDYTAAIRRLRLTLERRLAENENPPPEPVSRVAYVWRRLGLALRERVGASGLSLRALGSEIGVTSTDLSRLTSASPARCRRPTPTSSSPASSRSTRRTGRTR